MKEFIKSYDEVFPLFKTYGFKDPWVYRKKSGFDSDKVLIFVTDMYTDKTKSARKTDRLWDLKSDLKKYISCEFLFLTPENLHAETIEELKSPDFLSVSLVSGLSSKKLEEELVRIFGEEWVGVKDLPKEDSDTNGKSMSKSLAKFRLNAASVSKTDFSSLDETARFLSKLPESEYSEVLRKVQELRTQQASRQTLISSK